MNIRSCCFALLFDDWSFLLLLFFFHFHFVCHDRLCIFQFQVGQGFIFHFSGHLGPGQYMVGNHDWYYNTHIRLSCPRISASPFRPSPQDLHLQNVYLCGIGERWLYGSIPAAVLILLGTFHVVKGTCLKGDDDEDDSTGSSNHDSSARYSTATLILSFFLSFLSFVFFSSFSLSLSLSLSL
jgi:hypothetical protein